MISGLLFALARSALYIVGGLIVFSAIVRALKI